MNRQKIPGLSLFLSSLLCVMMTMTSAQSWNPNHKTGTIDGKYNFPYNQAPSQLVEIYPAAFPNTGLYYQWYSSTSPVSGFTAISGATASSYSPPALSTASVTTYYYRQTSFTPFPSNNFISSNTIKISVVSVNWEDLNYIRVHDVLNTGYTTWAAIDQLAIGVKLMTTTYLDGLGRNTEKVSAGTATPATGSTVWGDMVQFSQYDVYGREATKYLPYTTTNQPGKYKTAPLTDQPQYYTSTYNETAAYSSLTFDNSPLNRVTNVKEPGTAWSASAGSSAAYDVNSATENVQIWGVDYVQGNPPVNKGAYPANTLYKMTYTDVNGKQVIEYTNKSGQLVLKKVQIDATPSAAHSGWICTYNVYDEFGLLRYQLQPEAVKWLDANAWNFAAANGTQVLNELCFQYNYDTKGRTTWKKAPGAAALNMIYDGRDRVVFTQDGNQAALSTPQWTASLYDELDRPVASTLYNTTETVAMLQTDIANAPATTTVTVANAGTANVTLNISINPISAANLNNTAVCTPLKYLFYDNYSFPLVKSFNTGFTNTSAYSATDPNVIPIATSQRTWNMPTGALTRVLGSTTFLASTRYYDEKAHHIQTLEDNIKGGADITTLQYYFDNRLLSTCSDHTTSGTGYTNFKTLTKYNFDQIGRVVSIQKQYGSNAM
jgi:hypothetical protein